MPACSCSPRTPVVAAVVAGPAQAPTRCHAHLLHAAHHRATCRQREAALEGWGVLGRMFHSGATVLQMAWLWLTDACWLALRCRAGGGELHPRAILGRPPSVSAGRQRRLSGPPPSHWSTAAGRWPRRPLHWRQPCCLPRSLDVRAGLPMKITAGAASPLPRRRCARADAAWEQAKPNPLSTISARLSRQLDP